MKKFFLLFFIGVIIVSCSDDYSIVSSVDNNNPLKMLEAYASSHFVAMLAYQSLMEVCLNGKTRAVSTDYPSYYGGAYINENNKLIVYSTDLSFNSDIYKLTGTNNIMIEQCTYSYSELTNVMEALNGYKKKNFGNDIARNFDLFYVDDAHNCIVVELKDYSENSIKAFKENVSNSSAIIFRQSKGDFRELVDSVNAGSQITLAVSSTQTGYGSVGYRAKTTNGTIGIVTAAHVALKGKKLKYKGVEFAQADESRWQNSGNLDAAFCPISNFSYQPANLIDGSSNYLSTSLSLPGVGTLVNKRGQTTGSSSGNIVSTNASCTVGTTLFEGLTSVSKQMTCQGGDSGGIVYTYVSAQQKRFTVGIIKGIDANGLVYYTKAPEIDSAFNLSRY